MPDEISKKTQKIIMQNSDVALTSSHLPECGSGQRCS